jgi:ectoine hydroxylase-related dioxygenase (phytanoyl-CoA dioxygenase family)
MSSIVDANDAKKESQASNFHRDGFLVIPEVIEPSNIEMLYEKAMTNFHELEEILRGRCGSDNASMLSMKDLMGIGIKNCYKEIVQRHSMRFEMPYKMDDDDFSIIIQTSGIMDVVKEILGDDCTIINKSLVLSAPGAVDQAWHSDGPHVSATENLPCHCLNVFLPLVDVTNITGPTQFRPGSVNMTRNLKIEMLKAMVKKTLRPIQGPTFKRGSVLLFDYRILHRGTANKSDVVRPVLVYTFAKPFYRDTLNFPRNSVFDPLKEQEQEQDQDQEREQEQEKMEHVYGNAEQINKDN